MVLLVLFIPVLTITTGCLGSHRQRGDYLAVASITRGQKLNADGNEIKVWGFVDHSNIFANGAQQILEQCWAGDCSAPAQWRFSIKSGQNAETGSGHFSVYAPNDQGRDALLKAFLADAKAGRPTEVFVKGRVSAAKLHSNFSSHVHVRIDVTSSQDILLEYAEKNEEVKGHD